VLQSPEIREAFAPQGAEVVANSSEEFTRQLNDDVAKWKKVIGDLKLRID
jgi:tripartite-type tricarboxylate transporter receptor subunit TctC